MPREYVIRDDFDGTVLDKDTKPVVFIVGTTEYSLYLSEDNHGQFLDALNPFIEKAESRSFSRIAAPKSKSGSSASSADAEQNRAARHWARETGYKYENVKGEMVTMGERGRVPEVVIKAWQESGSPTIGNVVPDKKRDDGAE